MKPSLTPQKLRLTGFLGILGLLLASCGSYQQASYYDPDGIYAGGTERVTERVVVRDNPTPQPRNQEVQDGFYQNYFGDKARQLDEVLEGEIFTDADSYSSGREADSLGQVQGDYFQDYNNNYAGSPGWGDRGDNVTINLYGGAGWNNWGFYNPWLWNGWGYNNWGWGLGWNNWGWGLGWNNWGWPIYGVGSWYWAGVYNPWFGWNYYGWGQPFYRNYGFAAGRRGNYTRYSNINALGARSVMAANNTSRVRTNSGRSNLGTSNRYSSTRSNRSTLDAAARNRAYRTTRASRATPTYANRTGAVRTYTGAPRTYSGARGNAYGTENYRSRAGNTYSGRTGNSPGRSYQNSGSRTGRSYGTSPGYRSSGSSRSSGSFRGSSGSSRSSGSFRSSSGGSRSSGSMRSSGGGSRSSGSVRSSGGGGRSSGGRSSGRGN